MFKEKNKNKQKIIILSCFLFISVAYNIWWVGYERSGNAKTIENLNRYIEMSRDIIVSQEELRIVTANYAELATDTLFLCSDGDLNEVDSNAYKLIDIGDEIILKREKLEELFRKRTEFAETIETNLY